MANLTVQLTMNGGPIVYDGEDRVVTALLKNVGTKYVEVSGCFEVDGNETGWCDFFTLAPGDTDVFDMRHDVLPGRHEVTVFDAMIEYETREKPHIGEWNLGTLVDVKWINTAQGPNGSQEHVFDVRFHNGSTDVIVQIIQWDGEDDDLFEMLPGAYEDGQVVRQAVKGAHGRGLPPVDYVHVRVAEVTYQDEGSYAFDHNSAERMRWMQDDS